MRARTSERQPMEGRLLAVEGVHTAWAGDHPAHQRGDLQPAFAPLARRDGEVLISKVRVAKSRFPGKVVGPALPPSELDQPPSRTVAPNRDGG